MLLRIALLVACLALLVLGAEDYYKVCEAPDLGLPTSNYILQPHFLSRP